MPYSHQIRVSKTFQTEKRMAQDVKMYLGPYKKEDKSLCISLFIGRG